MRHPADLGFARKSCTFRYLNVITDYAIVLDNRSHFEDDRAPIGELALITAPGMLDLPEPSMADDDTTDQRWAACTPFRRWVFANSYNRRRTVEAPTLSTPVKKYLTQRISEVREYTKDVRYSYTKNHYSFRFQIRI